MEFSHSRQPSVDWIEYLDSWVTSMRVAGYTEATVRNWWYQVGNFSLSCGKPPTQVTTADVVGWLSRGVGNASWRSDHSATKSFFSYLVTVGALGINPLDSLPMQKRQKKKLGPAPQAAVDKGLSSTDWRVRLAVRLMADAGLRRNEVALGNTRDVIDSPAGRSLIVHGKGNKDRVVPLGVELGIEIGGLPSGWFFPGRFDGHAHPDTVYVLVKEATGWPPHSLRRKFATDLWLATHDVMEVKEFLGHESLQTTQQYISSSGEQLRGAVDALDRYRRKNSRHKQEEVAGILAANGIPESEIEIISKLLRGGRL